MIHVGILFIFLLVCVFTASMKRNVRIHISFHAVVCDWIKYPSGQVGYSEIITVETSSIGPNVRIMFCMSKYIRSLITHDNNVVIF